MEGSSCQPVKDECLEIAQKIKYYVANFYSLTPIELTEFLKLKGNLSLKGVVLNSEILCSQEDVLAGYIKGGPGTQCRDISLDALLAADLEAVEDERIAIRKQLFEHDVKIRIAPTGGSFAVQWNKKLNTCRIHIPSAWTTEIDHSLLISLYDRDLSHVPVEKSSYSVNEAIIQLFTECQDFALVKEQMQKENPKIDVSLFLLSVLQNAVEKGRIAFGQALEWIGLHRRRLISKFTALQNAQNLIS